MTVQQHDVDEGSKMMGVSGILLVVSASIASINGFLGLLNNYLSINLFAYGLMIAVGIIGAIAGGHLARKTVASGCIFLIAGGCLLVFLDLTFTIIQNIFVTSLLYILGFACVAIAGELFLVKPGNKSWRITGFFLLVGAMVNLACEIVFTTTWFIAWYMLEMSPTYETIYFISWMSIFFTLVGWQFLLASGAMLIIASKKP